MTGVKGKSGGLREGAGRPPQSVRIKHGSKILMSEKYQGRAVARSNGRALEIGSIEIDGRGKFRLVMPDGTEYTFMVS